MYFCTKTSPRKTTDALLFHETGFCVLDAVELGLFLTFDLSCELCG
jgi:hypothetical protein